MYNTETYLNNRKQIEFIYKQMEAYVEAYKESVNPGALKKSGWSFILLCWSSLM